MNDIRIYDFEFNLLHIEPDVMSAYWIFSYNDIGTFEGTFPLTSDICDVIMKNKYLFLIQGDFQAIITAYMADTKLTVYGKTVNWILSRRTCSTFNTEELYSTEEISPGDVMVKLAAQIFADVENFDFINSTDIVTSETYSKDSRVPFSDVVKEYLNQFNLGHKVWLDIPNKKWVFEVYSGKILPGVFSEENRNLTDVAISDDAQEFFSSGWYNRELEDLGEWDISTGEENNMVRLPSASTNNYGKYYSITDSCSSMYPDGSYLVCTDSTGKWRVCSELPTLEEKIEGTLTGIYNWDTFLSATNLSEAKAEMIDKQWSHVLKALAIRLKYNADFSLGDTVRIQAQKGTYTEAAEKTIVGVDIWWESGNTGEKIKFKEEI